MIHLDLGESHMKICFVMLAAFALASAVNSSASALSRYECKGVASQTIVLTPYQDGSVNLSFDKGPAEATAKFFHHGDVFTAAFNNLAGVQDYMLIYIFDTMTKNGYEYFRMPGKGFGAGKITCWWFEIK